MILGILSDTHGERERTAHAIRGLRTAGAEIFAHCGDVGGAAVLDELAGLDIHIVCGNTDCPDSTMVEYAAGLGLRVGLPSPVRFTLDGRNIALFHGHERAFEELIDVLIETRQFPPGFEPCDYVLHGHTHIARALRLGPVRVINPGALHRAPRYTVATLDMATGALDYWQLGHSDGELIPCPS